MLISVPGEPLEAICPAAEATILASEAGLDPAAAGHVINGAQAFAELGMCVLQCELH